MRQQLSLSARPKSLDQLIGQDKLVERIRGHVKAGRMQKAWLFTGPRGTGKTSVAKIIALSFQCEHQKIFGVPCIECRRGRAGFDIYEINAAKVTGVREIEQLLEGAYYAPRFGRYRVYILDEAHRMSEAAQNLALKYLEEDTPDSTVFILCSTSPQKIIETLQSRCLTYRLKELEPSDVDVLVVKLLTKIESSLPADRLSAALNERGIGIPRLIAMAVEKYASGAQPEEAVEVEGSTTVDVEALVRAMVKGDWPAVALYLSDAQLSDIRAIRLSCIAYLRKILWQSPEIGERTSAVAKAITFLCGLQNAEDLVISAGLTAVMYNVTSIFSKYKH